MASQIDVHVAKRQIYWCDQGNKDSEGAGIHRRGTDGAGYQRIISSGIGAKGIKGLAIDWIAGTFSFFFYCKIKKKMQKPDNIAVIILKRAAS